MLDDRDLTRLEYQEHWDKGGLEPDYSEDEQAATIQAAGEKHSGESTAKGTSSWWNKIYSPKFSSSEGHNAPAHPQGHGAAELGGYQGTKGQISGGTGGSAQVFDFNKELELGGVIMGGMGNETAK